LASRDQSESSTTPEPDGAFALPHEFPTLPARERREIVWRLAQLRLRHRDSAAEAIAHAYEDGEPRVIPALTAALDSDPDKNVKRHAAYGLSCIADRAVAPALRRALGLTDRATKGHAALGLGRLGAREAVSDLASLLDDAYSRMRAADALVAISDEQALGPLRQAAARGSPLRRRRLRKRVAALETALGARSSR
jgi:HEAT repeat protein